MKAACLWWPSHVSENGRGRAHRGHDRDGAC